MAGKKTLASVAAILASLLANSTTAQILGDYNCNDVLDADDINLMTIVVEDGLLLGMYDLNADGITDEEDRRIWVHQLACTYYGDANVDGEFNSGDLVQVFEAGKYETKQEAGWDDGDFDGDLLFTSSDLVFAFVDGGYEIGPRLLGDYNRNGLLDAGDLDLQAKAIAENIIYPYDLNNDGAIDFQDRDVWVYDLKYTCFGDANLDLEFDSSDFVQVFQRGRYETGKYAGWEEGDWNGDGLFDSSDMTAAFVDGGYERGLRTDAVAVPEPHAAILLSAAIPSCLYYTTRRRRLWRIPGMAC